MDPACTDVFKEFKSVTVVSVRDDGIFIVEPMDYGTDNN